MGERLGRYNVLKHLASGGMADVLLARTEGIEGFERHVVLKRIKPEHAKDQRFIQMFLDEARTAANLHHQNIVQVYDIGETNDGYFFAMEYIHGEDLRKLLSAVSKTKTHMPLGYVCGILSAAASGLHYAHERRDNRQKALNIVHRDVSPSNILIGYDGAVKVVDFGIAKAATRAVETRSGSLKGKVSYMSPEQCKGEDIDRRSDVWALGVLLYELATTTRLFKGDNDYLVMDAIVNGKVPLPRVRRPDLPNELSSIIMRALSTDRNRRYATADELRIALDQFAIKNNLTASTSALATYMRKMFGERPEPWLELESGQPAVDVDAPTQAAGASWTEMPREVIGATDAEDAALAEDAKTTTGGKRSRRSIVTAAAVADTIAPPISTRETRTSMKLGWEAHGKAFVDKHGRRLWVVAPLLVIAALGIWRLTSHDDDAAPAKTAAAAPAPKAAPAPAPAPTVTPIAPPAAAPERDIPAIRVAGPEEPADETAEAAKKAEAKDRIAAKIERIDQKLDKLTAKSGKSDKPAKSDKTDKVAAAVPTKGGSPTKGATPAPAPATPAPAPTPPPPAATPPPAVTTPPPAPAPAPPPAEVEAQIASLSNATVSAIASDHARQLAQCEGGNTLHGDVAVTFQIDGTGKVVKSQLMSSIKNPKVAACILKAVQSWKFPKPPTGSAKGVYSISYQ